jgi:hypothetical protein
MQGMRRVSRAPAASRARRSAFQDGVLRGLRAPSPPPNRGVQLDRLCTPPQSPPEPRVTPGQRVKSRHEGEARAAQPQRPRAKRGEGVRPEAGAADGRRRQQRQRCAARGAAVMVQVEPDLTLTLKHVSRCGATLPTEALVRGRRLRGGGGGTRRPSAPAHRGPPRRARCAARRSPTCARPRPHAGGAGPLAADQARARGPAQPHRVGPHPHAQRQGGPRRG